MASSIVRIPMLVAAAFAAYVLPSAVLAHDSTRDPVDAVTSGIEQQYHLHRTHIPMLWLASGAARIYSHNGVRNLRLVTFEDIDQSDQSSQSGGKPIDSDNLNHLVADSLGSSWTRMVHTHERSGEDSRIYVRTAADHGDRMEMFLVNLDHDELSIIYMQVDPRNMAEQISKESHAHSTAID